jgi:hypothetical protein
VTAERSLGPLLGDVAFARAWHPLPCEAEPSTLPGLSLFRTIRVDGSVFARLQRAPFSNSVALRSDASGSTKDLGSDTDQGILCFLYQRQNLFN